ncbi:DUF4083 domain-containing protein [Bacillus haikouensis]|uniref:DUF4083 domain-containing protein n=1 Tax=Bacillus haikouensis TaxID=1510468 RepID=UPI0015573181|nr:DUF4083 domain-containing protein [Bacillus haikouensis]NQD64415.1 DUF4083 domain-containing protein [Bacillus haikouensis]
MFTVDYLYLAFIICLLILGAVSFARFIRSLLINTKLNFNNSDEINKKLDRIIELLEKQSK